MKRYLINEDELADIALKIDDDFAEDMLYDFFESTQSVNLLAKGKLDGDNINIYIQKVKE